MKRVVFQFVLNLLRFFSSDENTKPDLMTLVSRLSTNYNNMSFLNKLALILKSPDTPPPTVKCLRNIIRISSRAISVVISNQQSNQVQTSTPVESEQSDPQMILLIQQLKELDLENLVTPNQY